MTEEGDPPTPGASPGASAGDSAEGAGGEGPRECVSAQAIARLERLGGRELLGEMISLFTTHTPERLALVREGLASGDLSLSMRGSHSMKSTAANFGAARLSELAAGVEAAAKAGAAARVQELYPELEQEVNEVLAALSNLGS